MTLPKEQPTTTAEQNGNGEVPIPAPEAQPAIEEVVTNEVIQNILTSHDADLELEDYKAELGSQIGDNYMSIMYSVVINAKSKATGAKSTLHIMLKTIPRNAFRQQMINEMKAFEKEGRMYREVFQDFISFQKEKGLEEDEIFRGFPTCYSAVLNGTTDYLALENLRIPGFKMGNRITGLDEEHSNLVISNLAKFHAVSFAMFQGDYDKILEKYPFLQERMFKKPEETEEVYKQYMKQTYQMEGDTLRKAGLEKEAQLVEGVYDEDYYGRLLRLCGQKVPWAVIGHGDCWTNNMLFRYDGDKLVEHKFIDFQISRASSRTIDLNYFLYTSPRMDLIDKEDDLLRVYHDSFTAFASRLGYTNEELTYEALRKEMNDFRAYGITMGLMLAPILNANKEDVPDLETMQISDHENKEEMAKMAKEFYADLMNNDRLTKKLAYIANHHIAKCSAWSNPQ